MRVIAGRLGGRKLTAPRGAATRPTSDRVREALFSALGDLEGAVVCDLYAGTGALGIEALSRGARRAVFVESGRPALAALRQNLSALRLEPDARVIALPVERALTLLHDEGPYDLALLDPPYAALPQAAAAAARLAAALAPGGRLVLEHAARDAPPDIQGLTRQPTRTYGDTAVSVYARSTP
ncbi:MAG: 16S rRNA (guanine(966)-N(2))-methyltransferase RsmD [Polyangiaceae bacterium]|nr:16S rRNA (guanine(966)-N(2))-methyltransferase RsmD [Polyangiaceae bacterium]